MKEEKPKGRVVELGASSTSTSGGGMAPPIGPQNENERLEEMIRLANLMAEQNNNQNGNGKKNNSKEVRAKRRSQKLARKKGRYK